MFLVNIGTVWAVADGRIDEIFALQRQSLAKIASMDMVYFEDWKPSKYLLAQGPVPSYLEARRMGFRYQQEGVKFRMETGIDGTLDNRPNSWRIITAFDLHKNQFYRKDRLSLRVQNKRTEPAEEYNLPFLRPYRFMFLHRDEFSLADLQNPAIWDDLKKRVRRLEQTSIAGRECTVMEIDYSAKDTLYRVYFANDLACYPVKVQVLSKAFQKVGTDLTVEEIKQYDTEHGSVVFPLVIKQVNMDPEKGEEAYTITYSVDESRFSVNADIPDSVFTIPLHMVREYEDVDDIHAYFNADDIAERGLEQLSLDRDSEVPGNPATTEVGRPPAGSDQPSEDPPIPSGAGTPDRVGQGLVESGPGPGRLVLCVGAVLLVVILVGRGIYHQRGRSAR